MCVCVCVWGGGGGGGLMRIALASASESHFFVCTISCEPVVAFLPSFHTNIIELIKLVTLL